MIWQNHFHHIDDNDTRIPKIYDLSSESVRVYYTNFQILSAQKEPILQDFMLFTVGSNLHPPSIPLCMIKNI